MGANLRTVHRRGHPANTAASRCPETRTETAEAQQRGLDSVAEDNGVRSGEGADGCAGVRRGVAQLRAGCGGSLRRASRKVCGIGFNPESPQADQPHEFESIPDLWRLCREMQSCTTTDPLGSENGGTDEVVAKACGVSLAMGSPHAATRRLARKWSQWALDPIRCNRLRLSSRKVLHV
jgi:hypothetical protein